MHTCGHILELAREHAPARIVVDAVGMGAGLFDRLLELQRPCTQVIDTVGAVEEGILRVAVQMDEGHLRTNSDPDPSRQMQATHE